MPFNSSLKLEIIWLEALHIGKMERLIYIYTLQQNFFIFSGMMTMMLHKANFFLYFFLQILITYYIWDLFQLDCLFIYYATCL